MSKKMYVLIGNYGSGKTELALNFAIGAAARGERTELLDLDMVNTYFRLTEPGRLMRMKDIRVVSPNFTNSSVETLSLPAEVQSAFAMDWDTVVFDVGGDAVGSTALGRYHQEEMEVHSRLKITGMINNTNLAQVTTPEELRDGYEMIRQVSEKTGVPVLYTSGKKAMLDLFLAEGHDPRYIGTPFPIDTYMARDWESWVRSL